MPADPRTWGVEHRSLFIALAGLALALTQPLALLLQKRQYEEASVGEDPILRAEWAARLRSGTAGTAYRDALSGALGWLTRVFGPPGSFQALAVCFLVAAAYAYAAFLIGWGFFGAQGSIGGLSILPSQTTQPARAIITLMAIILPPLLFFLSRAISRLVRNKLDLLKACIDRRASTGFSRQAFRSALSVLLAAVVLAPLLLLAAAILTNPRNHDPRELIFGAGAFLVLLGGPYLGLEFGCRIGRRLGQSWWSDLAAFATATGSSAIVYAAFLLPFVLITTFAAAFADHFVIMRAFTVTVAVCCALLAIRLRKILAKLLIWSSVFFTAAIVGLFCFAIVIWLLGQASSFSEQAHLIEELVSFVVIVGFSTVVGVESPNWNGEKPSALIASAVGALSGFGILLLSGRLIVSSDGITTGSGLLPQHPFVVLAVLFFTILPAFNSLFDWLSWWATRALGARLLVALESTRGLWTRVSAVLGHGLADVAVSVALLLLMAFALGLGFQVYNDFAILKGQSTPFDLVAVIDTDARDPWGDGFWITMMLLTTLLPTFGHGVMLLGAPLGVMLIPDHKREALADDLDNYANAGDRQANIRRRAARWYMQERTATWLLGGVLLFWLLVRFWVLYPAGIIDWAAGAAHAGVEIAR